VADGLVELLLADLAPRAASRGPDADAHEPSALPLLSHALLAAWEHSHGGRLTVADYMASGGIKDAIARTAERVYADLDPDQRDLARQLFLRLVHVADDAPETRSTVRLADLPGGGLPGTPAGDLLDRFVRARLISTGPGTAQFTHDALLTAWPRLRGWIDDSHEDLRIRRRVSEAARAWAQTARDDAALLRGGPLEAALEWADREGDPASLSPLNREFIAVSQDQQDIRQQAERRRTRRLHNLVSALSALVLVAAGLAVYAFQQRHAASAAQSSAMAASHNAQKARNNYNSRQVAIEAAQARKHNVALAAQLSLAAFQIARTPQARSSLLDSTGTPAAAQLTDSGAQISAVSLSPDRKMLAVAAVDGSLKLWDVADPGLLPAHRPAADRPERRAAAARRGVQPGRDASGRGRRRGLDPDLGRDQPGPPGRAPGAERAPLQGGHAGDQPPRRAGRRRRGQPDPAVGHPRPVRAPARRGRARPARPVSCARLQPGWHAAGGGRLQSASTAVARGRPGPPRPGQRPAAGPGRAGQVTGVQLQGAAAGRG
jgi:hypothetical protein